MNTAGDSHILQVSLVIIVEALLKLLDNFTHKWISCRQKYRVSSLSKCFDFEGSQGTIVRSRSNKGQVMIAQWCVTDKNACGYEHNNASLCSLDY
jgi:hypothetical protein